MSTIKDVAKYAGVSTATVSRVINHAPNVRPETVARVNEAIAACHFVPNFVARNLKSEQTKTIGFLVSDIANSYFTIMAKALEIKLQKLGYDMMVCSTDDDPAMEKSYLTQFQSNRVAGIVLNTTGKNTEFIETLSQSIPMVLVERSVSSARFCGDFIGADNRAGMYSLASYLLERGHRRIAIVNGNLEVSTGKERYEGFVLAMKEYGITVDDRYPFLYNAHSFVEKKGYEAAEYLMGLDPAPTAVLVTNNALSLGALKYMKKHQVRIPEDVSVMCYGNIENSKLFFVEPAYTTLNPLSIADKVCQYIVSRIEEENLPNREMIFESKLYPGGSVAPVRE